MKYFFLNTSFFLLSLSIMTVKATVRKKLHDQKCYQTCYRTWAGQEVGGGTVVRPVPGTPTAPCPALPPLKGSTTGSRPVPRGRAARGGGRGEGRDGSGRTLSLAAGAGRGVARRGAARRGAARRHGHQAEALPPSPPPCPPPASLPLQKSEKGNGAS